MGNPGRRPFPQPPPSWIHEAKTPTEPLVRLLVITKDDVAQGQPPRQLAYVDAVHVPRVGEEVYLAPGAVQDAANAGHWPVKRVILPILPIGQGHVEILVSRAA